MRQVRATRDEVIQASGQVGFIPLFFQEDAESAIKIATACYNGGARLIEFTNRGIGAERTFSEIAKALRLSHPDMLIGAGSVCNAAHAISFIGSGADFIVAPFYDEETRKICSEYKVAWMPGCGTLSELQTAHNQGAAICKLFPALMYGPSFVKAVLAPCPWLKIMPTGGIKAEAQELNNWREAGAHSVGLGSDLIPAGDLIQERLIEIEQKVKALCNTL